MAESLAMSYAVERLTGFINPWGLSNIVERKFNLAQFLFISDMNTQTSVKFLNYDRFIRNGSSLDLKGLSSGSYFS